MIGEFELIDRFLARTAMPTGRPDVILGIGDDAALLRVTPGLDLVAAVDTLVEGRHFLKETTPRSIGHRSLAVNLSDLAAMGARPTWATLSLTLPAADVAWLESFCSGFGALAAAHGVALVGGDTTAGPLTISVQIMGEIERGTALRRAGAQPGDLIAVTGSLGDSGGGLALLTGVMHTADRTAADELIARYDYPTPRVEFGRGARGIANAAMDLSDGLAGDVPKLAAASGVAATVDVARLPLSPSLRAVTSLAAAREFAWGAGDDYELLLTVAPQRFDELADLAARLNLTLTVIGECRAGEGVTWSLDGCAITPTAGGYDHFR